ncbi:MAG TPA: glycosyltransferase family 2 protein [Vicinamibacteria bacterium]|nr:glycosyltransferase family 2 protein [Vicinamibacteria bacterium]
MAVDLSLCIVSLDCWRVLQDCLESVASAEPGLAREVILVDNASRDGTPERVRERFPSVRLIVNGTNVGFTRATNQAIRLSSGRRLVWLNPDTVLRPDSLGQLSAFLDAHPEVGIVGPKVLNADGSFQPQCRRGLPTPTAALAYMLRLHRLWPTNPRFGGYLMNHLPVDEATEVAAVSGCCLMARREVWDAIGPLDETIFGFGEDVEWCVRARNAGWQVWYDPRSVIVHLKGQGGVQSKPLHKVWGIHQAMWVFYRKHLRAQHSWPVTALVWAGVWSSFALSSLSVAVRRSAARVIARH